MLGFVIPVAPKIACPNWAHSSQLLERTLKSISHQTNPNFKIFLVYEDEPAIHLSQFHITPIKLDLKDRKAREMVDFESHVQKYFKPGYDDIMLNKAIKLTNGCQRAKLDGCTHVMCIDSDDLISNKISEFVSKNLNNSGWYVNKGYLWKEGSSFVQKHNQLTGINGSTHIIRTDLIPVNTKSNRFYDYTLFESHGYTRKRIWHETSHSLSELPFRGTTVVIHDRNASLNYFQQNRHSIKSVLKFIAKTTPLTSKIRKTFSLGGH